MAQITTAGIDLAKKVFALHGVDGPGGVMLRRTVKLIAPKFVAPYRKSGKTRLAGACPLDGRARRG